MPGALAAVAQDAATITIDMLESAQRIAGLSFTLDEQRRLLEKLNGRQGYLAGFARLRTAGLGNSTQPALVFNPILLGYGLPAVLAVVLALIARTTRPLPYRIVATVAAIALALCYLTLEVRLFFHGPIRWGRLTDAENYTLSTVWLIFGVAPLAVGFALRSAPARWPALAVIGLTIAKVFLVDTVSISGVYRALSAIGLGIVLLGIGWFYQHVLFPRTRNEAPS